MTKENEPDTEPNSQILRELIDPIRQTNLKGLYNLADNSLRVIRESLINGSHTLNRDTAKPLAFQNLLAN